MMVTHHIWEQGFLITDSKYLRQTSRSGYEISEILPQMMFLLLLLFEIQKAGFKMTVFVTGIDSCISLIQDSILFLWTFLVQSNLVKCVLITDFQISDAILYQIDRYYSMCNHWYFFLLYVKKIQETEVLPVGNIRFL